MRLQALRRKIYDIIDHTDRGGRAAAAFDGFLVTLIALNVVAIILESVAPVRQAAGPLFRIFEIASVIIFSIEYALRLWTADLKLELRSPALSRLRYAVTPLAIVDLLAIIPFYVPFLIPFDLRFLRILRIMRVFRMFKLQRYSASVRLLGAVISRRRSELIVTLFVAFILIVFASTLMYYIEGEAQPEAFPNILHAFWWAIATLTTIGYGDVYPVTGWGRLLSGVIAVLGIGLVALPTGILSSGLIEELGRKRGKAPPPDPGSAVRYCPHCGRRIDSPEEVRDR